jgi:acyl transferase domain-containing protein
LVCQSLDEAINGLNTPLTHSKFKPQNRPIVFLFSGQGAQYVNMAEGLYQHEPIFREQVDTCAAFLKPHIKQDLRSLLYPAQRAEAQLQETAIAQPALFVIEYALAQLWISWGIKPQAMIGHSLGEYVAAAKRRLKSA